MRFILKTILHWLILSCAVLVVTKIISGVYAHDLYVVFTVGAILTIFNMFFKPIINILTLPINLITLGLFPLIVNSVLFWYIGVFIGGFTVTTFYAAFLGSLLISIINWILSKMLHL